MKYLISLATGLLFFGLLSAATAMAAPIWTVDSLDAIGCNEHDIHFSTTVSGYTGGNERFRTTVDQTGVRFMDEDAGVPGSGNGAYGWQLYYSNSGGPAAGTWPLAQNTPITVHFMFINGPGGATVFDRQVVLSQCNGGSIISNQVLVGGASAVPTMNEWGMIIFMALAGLGSAFYLRKRRQTS